MLHWSLNSFSTDRVYPARPGPVLEFFLNTRIRPGSVKTLTIPPLVTQLPNPQNKACMFQIPFLQFTVIKRKALFKFPTSLLLLEWSHDFLQPTHQVRLICCGVVWTLKVGRQLLDRYCILIYHISRKLLFSSLCSHGYYTSIFKLCNYS